MPACWLVVCSHAVAFKAVPAGLVAGASIEAKTIASGLYTVWHFDASTVPTAIGTQADFASSPGTADECKAACDADAQCAGVYYTTEGAFTCKSIKGDSVPGEDTLAKRSMTHAVQANLA